MRGFAGNRKPIVAVLAHFREDPSVPTWGNIRSTSRPFEMTERVGGGSGSEVPRRHEERRGNAVWNAPSSSKTRPTDLDLLRSSAMRKRGEVRVIRGGYDEASSLFFKNGEKTRLVSFRSSLRVRDDGVSPFLRFLGGSRREGGAACRLPSLEKAGAWRGGGEIGLVIVALLRDITGY